MELGISPSSLFLDKSRMLSIFMSFQLYGIFPVKWLSERSMILEYCSLLNDEGMLLFNKFPKRARTLKLDKSPILEGMGPDNRLFPRRRYDTLYQSGSGPSKRLELKSAIHHPWEVPKDSGVGSFPLNWFLERSNHPSCGDSFHSHSGIVSEIPTLRRIIW